MKEGDWPQADKDEEIERKCRGATTTIGQPASRFHRAETVPLPILTQGVIRACQTQPFASTTSHTPKLSVMLSNIPTRLSMVCSLDNAWLPMLPLTSLTRSLSSITGLILVL